MESDFGENGWMREICGRLLAVRKRAGGRGEMRESPAECGRVGNYVALLTIHHNPVTWSVVVKL